MKTQENQIKEMSRKERKEYLIAECCTTLKEYLWAMIHGGGDKYEKYCYNRLMIRLRLLKNMEIMRHSEISNASIEFAILYHLRR